MLVRFLYPHFAKGDTVLLKPGFGSRQVRAAQGHVIEVAIGFTGAPRVLDKVDDGLVAGVEPVAFYAAKERPVSWFKASSNFLDAHQTGKELLFKPSAPPDRHCEDRKLLLVDLFLE